MRADRPSPPQHLGRGPELEERPIPSWQRLSALAAALALAAAVVLWRSRLPADFWPPDASRIAPNIVASVIQWAVVLLVAALLWPPTRRRIHRFVTGHTGPLHARLDRVEGLHRQGLEAHEEALRHLRHLVRYLPDVPPLPPPSVQEKEGDART